MEALGMENLESSARWSIVLSSMATSSLETICELWNLLAETKKNQNPECHVLE